MILVAVMACQMFATVFSCGISPAFWCDSYSIAHRCNVLEACKDRLTNQETGRTAAPVHVDVYFESYCPDSIAFVNKQLWPTWQALQDDGVLTFTLYPYGKATSIPLNDGTYRFSCQHGVRECEVNTIENCVISYSKSVPEVYMPIIHCIEQGRQHLDRSQECVEAGGIPWETINTCWKGTTGNQLMYLAGVATHGLDPEMNWVPWIVVNGVHTDEIQQAATDDLMTLVCSTYQGAKPAACNTRNRSQQQRSVPDKLKFIKRMSAN